MTEKKWAERTQMAMSKARMELMDKIRENRDKIVGSEYANDWNFEDESESFVSHFSVAVAGSFEYLSELFDQTRSRYVELRNSKMQI